MSSFRNRKEVRAETEKLPFVRRTWTKDEEEQLFSMRNVDMSFEIIGKRFNRKPTACKEYYKFICKYREIMRTWGQKEDRALMIAYVGCGKDFALVTRNMNEIFPGVTVEFCKKRIKELRALDRIAGQYRSENKIEGECLKVDEFAVVTKKEENAPKF